jgi:hypothetical protein
MENRKEQLEEFFASYAARFNAAFTGNESDPEATANCFAESFIEASPKGIVAKKNDSEFLEKIPQLYAMYKSIGITAMEIESTDVTLLDDLHAMVRAHWVARYTKDGKNDSVGFRITYLLQLQGQQYRIFTYITGDEEATLKELGLI